MGNKMLILFVLTAILAAVSEAYQHYCDMPTCDKGSHTLCRFRRAKAGIKCGYIIRKGLSDHEKTKILKLHTELRQKVYSGNEGRGSPGPQLPSINNATVEWDYELALSAQRWANQCMFMYDRCRNVERFAVGQNIALDMTYGNINVLNVDWMIRKWYEEVKLFNNTDIFEFRQDTKLRTKSWHYSQLIWGESTKIGCGGIRYLDPIAKFYLVCNYGPRGNLLGKKVYEIPN